MIISGLGFIVLLFTLPETMGIPLEGKSYVYKQHARQILILCLHVVEMAKLFGDEPETIAALVEQKDGDHVTEVRELKVHEGKQDESYV